MKESLAIFKVIGVHRRTGNDVELFIEALNEANARVKADLKGIIVTCVKQVPDPAAASRKVSTPSPGKQAPPSDKTPQQPKPVKSQEFEPKPDRWKIGPAALVALVLGILTSICFWLPSDSKREPIIAALANHPQFADWVNALGWLVGANLFSVITLLLSTYILWRSRGQKGKCIMGLALLAILANFASELIRKP